MDSLTVGDTTAEVRRSGWVGLVGNVALTVVKGVAGVVGHSHAVVADAAHSLTDIVTDVAIIAGVRYWSQPADDRHPHGHHRIETVVTLAIGLLLVAVAVSIAWESIRGDHVLMDGTPSGIALAAALLSLGVKEVLYRWTVAVGRRVDSPAVVANAWHHRSDAFSSIPAALAVAVAMAVPGWAFVDRVGAVVVCVFILYAAYRIVAPALAELVDTAAPEEDRQRIEQIALAVGGVLSAHALRTRHVGPKLAVDLHVEVDAALTVAEGYRIGQTVRRQLLETGPNVADVVVQVEPYRRDNTSAPRN